MTERCKVMTMNEKECCERIREIKKFVRYPDGAKVGWKSGKRIRHVA